MNNNLAPNNSMISVEEPNKDKIVKALKLFAKNHKQLDKICKVKNPKSIFSRKRNNGINFIKASTKQKEG